MRKTGRYILLHLIYQQNTMKLHLPKLLLTAVLAACCVQLTCGGDTISINFTHNSSNVTTNHQGELGGIAASGWTNIAAGNTSGATVNNQSGTAAGIISITNVANSWESKVAAGDSLTSVVQRGYIDVPNHQNQVYTISVDHDYWLTDVTFYMSADTADKQFASLNVNGTSYKGGDTVTIGSGGWGATGNPAGVTNYDTSNSLTVAGVVGDLVVKNDYPKGDTRATLAGIQVKDVSDTSGYYATLNEGETSATNAAWVLNGASVSYADIDAAKKNLGIRANENGSTLVFTGGETISSIAAVENTVTVKADSPINLSSGLIYIYEGAGMVLDASLSGTKNVVSSKGSITLNGSGTFSSITTANLTVGGNVVVDGTFGVSGSVAVGKGATLALKQVDAGATILKATGSGTIETYTTTVINGTQLRNEASATPVETSFTGTIAVKGGTLVIGNNGQWNGYWGIDLSSLTSIDLDGGSMKLFGSDSDISVINVKKNAQMNIWEATAVNGKGFAIEEMHLDANLTSHATWDSTLSIGKLVGTGDITFTKDRGYNVTIGSIESCGVITNGVTMSLGADENSVINLSNTIRNTGDITFNGQVAIAVGGAYELHELSEEVSYTHSANGYQVSSGSTYYAIYGNGSVNLDAASVTYNGSSITLNQVSDGYVFTAGSVTDKSTFYVNTNVVAGSEGYTDMFEADTYTLAAEASLDVNGNYFAGKSFNLAAGSTLKNAGAGLNGNNKMFQSIELSGDATVEASANMGLLAFNSSDSAAATSTLKLNGHTLTKTGDKAFFLTGTNVEGEGTIKIQSGTMQVGIEVNHAKTAATSAAGAHFELAGGTLTIRESGNTLTAKSLSGNGTVSGNGKLILNNTGTAANHTITGNVSLGGLELTGNDNYTLIGNLNVSGYGLVHAGDLTLQSGTHFVQQLDISKGQASDSTLILESGAHLTAGTNLWLSKNAGITLLAGSSLTKGVVKIEAKSAAANATVSFLADRGDDFSIANSNFAFEDAKVSINKGEDGNLEVKLINSDLVNNGAGAVIATNSGNSVSGVYAKAGNITLQNVGESTSLNTLEVGAGKVFKVQTGDADSAAAAVAVTGSADLGSGASVEANLVVQADATLNMTGKADIIGSMEVKEGGIISFGDGDSLSITGSLTLNASAVQLAFDITSATDVVLVTTTAGVTLTGTWNGISEYEYEGKTYTVGLSAADNALALVFREMVADGAEISTTVMGYDITTTDSITTLTLSVDAALSETAQVTVDLISDEIMEQILTELDGTAMVSITLLGTNGISVEGTSEGNVVFVNEDGDGYRGELVKLGEDNVAWQYDVTMIPEPTTTALSLLALCGLAARRRRK